MNRTEHVKNLLKKAIETNDEELIALASSLMSEQDTAAPIEKKDDNNEFIFTMPKSQNDNKRGVPINAIKKRVNTFQDDGVEAKDITTPDIKPTERKRPRFQPIHQICQKCNKSIQTHPTHKRDFFICDRCIGK
jgi:hypothetical protein